MDREPISLGGPINESLLREINRDSDGTVLSGHIEHFIDLASAVIPQVPADWKKYATNIPADLDRWLVDMLNITNELVSLQERPIGERSARITNRTPQAQDFVNRQLNPQSQFLLLLIMRINESKMSGLAEQQRRITELQTEANNASTKIKELLESTQEASAVISASGRARLFANEARSQDRSAIGWLVFSIMILITLILVAAMFATGGLISKPDVEDAFGLSNYILGKVLIIGSIGFALAFGTRQYATHRHNATMNRHRSHALRTYRALVLASKSEAAHDIVLTEAAEAIFAPHESGFIKGGSGDPSAVQIIQGLLRSPPPTSP